jgi:hypothetical protein
VLEGLGDQDQDQQRDDRQVEEQVPPDLAG